MKRIAICPKCGKVIRRFHGNKHIITCKCGGVARIKDVDNKEADRTILGKLIKMYEPQMYAVTMGMGE